MFLFDYTDHHLEFPSQPPHWLPGVKPVGPVQIDRTHLLGKGVIEAYVPSGVGNTLVSGKPGTLQDVSDVTMSIKGLALTNGLLRTNAGLYFNPSDFTFDGLTQLSLFAMVELDTSYSAQAHTIFRETSATGTGVTLVVGQTGGNSVRGLINTTGGTTLWTGGADESIASWLGKWVVIGMTWDGANRHLYIGEVGCNSTLLDSDVCTGTVDITDYSNAKSVIGGGLNATAYSYEKPMTLLVGWNRCLSAAEVNMLTTDPYQFLIPA